MAKRLLLRDAENVSGDMLQRILGSFYASLPAIAGVGSGYSTGSVGSRATASTGHLAVTANGVNLQLTILPGWAAVLRDAGGSSYDPRVLFAESDANDTSVTLTSNATGSTRNDTVCLKVDQVTAPNSDGSNLPSFVAIAGQSGGGLSNAPADGNLYLPLGNVAVANGATFVSQANVSDLRLNAAAAGTLLGQAWPLSFPAIREAEIVALRPQLATDSPATPTGTATGGSGVMMGLSSGATFITPQVTGRVLVIITGRLQNSTATAGDGTNAQIRYGAGNGPANGAAPSGTAIGSLEQAVNERAAVDPVPFCCVGVITGAALGTGLWIDLAVAAVSAGTGTVNTLTRIAIEF